MRMVDIINKKRGNGAAYEKEVSSEGIKVAGSLETELEEEEIKFFIEGVTNKTIPDYQASALLMAIYFNGMTTRETALLTYYMLHSGKVLDLQKVAPSLPPPFIDKHSTGGVGDKVSIILAPLLACCGVSIPMMSGRGLGHTGGTLDKLEAITGYRTDLSIDEFIKTLHECGYSMIGQTKDIAPADKTLYSLRDVTATVESIPLITASILSKKLAEGATYLVFDVKCGEGAFMKTHEEALKLAKSLVKTAGALGKTSRAVITDMSYPLGHNIGNYLEIEECIDCLKGSGYHSDLMSITLSLAHEMLVLAGKKDDYVKNRDLLISLIDSGAALNKFYQNVSLQGGDVKKLKADYKVRRSPYTKEVKATEDGFFNLNSYKVGIASMTLGAGREKASDKVDADSGVIIKKERGERVKAGDLLMLSYAKDKEALETGTKLLQDAVIYDESSIGNRTLIYEVIK